MKKTTLLLIWMMGMICVVAYSRGVLGVGSSYTNGYESTQQVTKDTTEDTIVGVQEMVPTLKQIEEDSSTQQLVGDFSYNPIESFRIYQASAIILGSGEVPKVSTKSFAIGTFLIDIQSNRLTYSILEFDVGNETKAALLGPANTRTNSNMTLFTLPQTEGYKTGIWNYPQSMESDLLSGRVYVNIYTTQHPNGEIRGHIIPQKSYLVKRFVTTPTPQTHRYIDIINSTFIQNSIQARRGEIVVWRNRDNRYHTVKSSNGTEMNSGLIPPGYIYSHRFTRVGNYTYYDTLYPNMTGIVRVVN